MEKNRRYLILRELRYQKREMYERGKSDAKAGNPPAENDFVYIEGYEYGLLEDRESSKHNEVGLADRVTVEQVKEKIKELGIDKKEFDAALSEPEVNWERKYKTLLDAVVIYYDCKDGPNGPTTSGLPSNEFKQADEHLRRLVDRF
jgi:hypothetical protein